MGLILAKTRRFTMYYDVEDQLTYPQLIDEYEEYLSWCRHPDEYSGVAEWVIRLIQNGDFVVFTDTSARKYK